MAASGFQLTTFLYGLYAGRRKLPALPQYLARPKSDKWALGVEPGSVTLQCSSRAVQVDPTTCGSASIALAKASDPASMEAAVLSGAGERGAKAEFDSLQGLIKTATNRRKAGVAWPHKYGTPPWGASREMSFAGHRYFDRMVVDTSLPQSTRVLTHAAQCALRGFPVLLYVGGDTSMGWDAGVPRHVVVLHSHPALEPSDEVAESVADVAEGEATVENTQDQPADIELELERKLEELEAKIQAKLDLAKKAAQKDEVFDPEFLVYEPSRGVNTKVTLRQLIDRKTPKEAFGGWPHIMWAVMPEPQPQSPSH